LSFACEGAHFSLFPSLCAKIFGNVGGGLIFPYCFLSIPFSAKAITAIFEKLGPKVFYVTDALAIVNMVLLYSFNNTPMVAEKKRSSDDLD